MRRARRLAVAVCAVCVVAGLMTVAVAATHLARERSAARDFGVTASAAARPPDVLATSVPAPPSRPPTQVRLTPAPPIRIEIPALKVTATIEGVTSVDGELGVPDDPMTVGWWTGAAQPGSRSGSVVLDGHVDSASRGLGAFFALSTLHEGDAVTVTTARGDRVTYRVTARRSYSKAEGLPPDLFAGGGSARLVLITCGGQFDHDTRSYEDNIVVFAAPAAT